MRSVTIQQCNIIVAQQANTQPTPHLIHEVCDGALVAAGDGGILVEDGGLAAGGDYPDVPHLSRVDLECGGREWG